MSGELLQNLAVAAIVVAAIGFLGWRWLRRRARPSAMCGDCPGCVPAPKPDHQTGLVRIEGIVKGK